MPKLKYDEKVQINKHQQCQDLRESIMLLAEQLPAKIEGIDETRRLQWIKTQIGHALNEKKQVPSADRKEGARRRATEYNRNNKEKIQLRCFERREKIRSITASRLDEAN